MNILENQDKRTAGQFFLFQHKVMFKGELQLQTPTDKRRNCEREKKFPTQRLT